jgi:hypothetical protein
MRSLAFAVLLGLTPLIPVVSATHPPGWKFEVAGHSGIVAIESTFITPNLAVLFDRAVLAPLTIDGHSAWGALWNIDTNTVSPLRLVSDAFCGSGGFLSNGTLVRYF